MTQVEIDQKNAAARERRAKSCKHFNGIRNECCDAGVNYLQFGGARALPCLPAREGDATERATCPKFEALGMEQVLKDDAEFNEHFATLRAARWMIVEDAAKKLRSSGEVDCPRCRLPGALKYSISGNGHILARCEVPNCLAWIE